MCEPQAASSFPGCPRSFWDQLCTGATPAGFSESSSKLHLLSFGILLLNRFYMATLSPFALMFTEYNLVSIALQLAWKGEQEQLSAWCLGRNTWEAPVLFLRSYRLRGDRRVKLNSSAIRQADFYQKHVSLTANIYSINPHPITVPSWGFCPAVTSVQAQASALGRLQVLGLILSQAVSGPGSVALRGCLRC